MSDASSASRFAALSSGGRGLFSSFSPFASASEEPPPIDALLERERERNTLLAALCEDGSALREVLLAAADREPSEEQLHLLLPQSATLGDVEITAELVETHLVLLSRGTRGSGRRFTSLNGLCGTVQADGAVTVHGRLRRATAESDAQLRGGDGGWEEAASAGRGAIPQLESQISVLRETQLGVLASLPPSLPQVGLLLISDPLYFPGCGWKLPLALQRVTHRFRETAVEELPLAQLPQLLSEYQILARAWIELGGGGGGGAPGSAASASRPPV